jgi:hypothetical protein
VCISVAVTAVVPPFVLTATTSILTSSVRSERLDRHKVIIENSQRSRCHTSKDGRCERNVATRIVCNVSTNGYNTFARCGCSCFGPDPNRRRMFCCIEAPFLLLLMLIINILMIMIMIIILMIMIIAGCHNFCIPNIVRTHSNNKYPSMVIGTTRR